MELSKDTIDGLANILNTNIVTDDNFLQILGMATSYIYENPSEIKCEYLFWCNCQIQIRLINIIIESNKISGTIKTSDAKPILTKKVFADVVCLLIEATRHDLDEESLRSFLNLVYIGEKRITKLCEVYINNKKAIQSQLELIGNNPPHIIDIDWHLDYCVKVIDR